MFLKISHIPLENTSVGVSFNKVAGLKGCNSIEKRLQHRCFTVKFAKFFRTSFSQNCSSGCACPLTRVFKGICNKNRCDCKQKCQIQLKKIFSAAKVSTSVTNLSKGGSSWIFYPSKPLFYDKMILSCNVFSSLFLLFYFLSKQF